MEQMSKKTARLRNFGGGCLSDGDKVCQSVNNRARRYDALSFVHSVSHYTPWPDRPASRLAYPGDPPTERQVNRSNFFTRSSSLSRRLDAQTVQWLDPLYSQPSAAAISSTLFIGTANSCTARHRRGQCICCIRCNWQHASQHARTLKQN